MSEENFIDQNFSIYLPYVLNNIEFIKNIIEGLGLGKIKMINHNSRFYGESPSYAIIYMEYWSDCEFTQNFQEDIKNPSFEYKLYYNTDYNANYNVNYNTNEDSENNSNSYWIIYPNYPQYQYQYLNDKSSNILDNRLFNIVERLNNINFNNIEMSQKIKNVNEEFNKLINKIEFLTRSASHNFNEYKEGINNFYKNINGSCCGEISNAYIPSQPSSSSNLDSNLNLDYNKNKKLKVCNNNE